MAITKKKKQQQKPLLLPPKSLLKFAYLFRFTTIAILAITSLWHLKW
jgi:hypothetical protein